MIFIEVPDATTMIKNLRYDQIFHQHYHYFTLNSLKNLATKAGLKVIDYDLNKNFGAVFNGRNEKNKIIKNDIKKI